MSYEKYTLDDLRLAMYDLESRAWECREKEHWAKFHFFRECARQMRTEIRAREIEAIMAREVADVPEDQLTIFD